MSVCPSAKFRGKRDFSRLLFKIKVWFSDPWISWLHFEIEVLFFSWRFLSKRIYDIKFLLVCRLGYKRHKCIYIETITWVPYRKIVKNMSISNKWFLKIVEFRRAFWDINVNPTMQKNIQLSYSRINCLSLILLFLSICFKEIN